ncbi:hypothetical protein CCUS01_11640 [Colletotrichum cuscutae]|uniref:DUF6604 domain-containing protein n=1 Tax=Colletotrichum cuscutae TaxID=1209917 RepID=A0AAI9TYN9_9PEZI|nr:hypothetical protein CCUS01_11640 [Colletotrichum cuscutae]
MQAIPPATFRLFRSVINARTEHLAFLRRIVSEEDPQYGKDIKIHDTFVRLVTEAFVALGGNSWIETEQSRGVQDRLNTSSLTPEKLADFINFSALDLKSLSLESSGESSSDTVPVPLRESQRRAQAKSGRGGKGKKKAKKAPGALLNQVPIDQYSIVEADGTGEAESFMAACAIAKECVVLRNYLQNVWREAAYCGLHGAIAVFSEVPELQSYETLVAAIIRGNLETAQGSFIKALAKLSPGDQHGGTKTTSIDLKEYIQLGTYRDLVDFLEDYQQSEDGKPTTKMLIKIKDWDPTLDLQHTTKRERLKWRRSYTINWLYDLVNSYTAPKRSDGEWVRLENLPNCPLAGSEPLLGLQDFACFVVSLLMKKPGTDVHQDIMPHRVFQLQCIVDAFTVSCGWTNTTRRGHVIGPRSPDTLGPMKDIDGFLGRRPIGNGNQESSVKGKGKSGTKLYIGDIELSIGDSTKDDSNIQNDDKNLGFSNGLLLSANLMAHFYGAELRNAHRQPMMDFVSVFCREFDFLGQSVPMTGVILPTSRFDHTGLNGMWRYSPYLCGVGVMEGLERVYRTSMLIWDSLEEPTAMIHLHNMLVQQGHIKQPLAHYQVLQDMFRDSFFPDGQVPRSNFAEAFLGIGELLWGDGRVKQKPALPKSAGYHRSVDVSRNLAFNTKSHLLIYREANWHVEWIPDKELNPRTRLALLRASRLVANTPLNSMTKDEKSLVDRVKKALGVDDQELLSRGNALLKKLGETRPHQSNTGRNGRPIEVVSGDRVRPSRVQILDLIKGDLYNDICGNRSYSTFNYILLYVNMIETFEKIEYELARAQDSDCQSILELGTRLHMVDALMRKERERTSLKIVAKILESQRELPCRYPRNEKPVETWYQGEDSLDYDGNGILCSVM